MAERKAGYLLTETAEADFYEARTWSLERWGPELTGTYFEDLHKAAQYVAANHGSLAGKDRLTGSTGLSVHVAREHYLVYVPFGAAPVRDVTIAVVALIRQGRDVSAILKNNAHAIRRAVEQLNRVRCADG